MAQPSATDWATGWDAKDAPQIGFAFLRADADQWQDGPWPGLQSMELGLTEASKGMFSARRVRVAPGKSVPRTVGADTGWYRHDGDFDFVYVLHGAVMVETEDGAHHTLGPGASATYPRLTARREYAATPDLEYLWVTVPGELPVVGGGEAPAGARRHHLRPAGQLRRRQRPAHLLRVPRPGHRRRD
jgi:quercetin dioxygenase-like cupin family protein